MKTYTVKPEGINLLRKRMLIFGAAFFVLVLAGVGLIMPDFTPLSFGIGAVVVVLFGGIVFHSALRRLDETWPSYTLTVGEDYILKQQAHYPDIRIERDEIRTIQKIFTGEIAVKTRDWMKFIVIPPSLIGIQEVESQLRQWKPIKEVPRVKTLFNYVLPIVIVATFFTVARGCLRGNSPDPVVVAGTVIVILILNVLLMATMRRIPNLDDRSKPKRWKVILAIAYVVLMLVSFVVFYGLEK